MARKTKTIQQAYLLALITTAFAGTARVVSNCGADVPVWVSSVIGNQASEWQPLGGGYSEPYARSVGVSIKISPTKAGKVTQFEYMWDPAGTRVNYDISNIDGNPFADHGMQLTPSKPTSAEFPTCVVVDCPAGQTRCEAAYNLPDDVRTMVCPDFVDLTFTLCPGGPPAGGALKDPAGSATAPKAPAASAKLVASGKSLNSGKDDDEIPDKGIPPTQALKNPDAENSYQKPKEAQNNDPYQPGQQPPPSPAPADRGGRRPHQARSMEKGDSPAAGFAHRNHRQGGHAGHSFD